MVTLTQAILYGVVLGLTQFLPLSGSGHLILLPWFLGWAPLPIALRFFLHVGAFVALLLYFSQDIFGILIAGLSSIIERKIGFDRDRLLFWLVFVATVPIALAGFFFHNNVREIFGSPLPVAIAMAFGAFMMYWVDGKFATLKGIEELRFSQAFLIGLAQALSVIPGISAVAASLTMGRLLGLNREAGVNFSFLLLIPVMVGQGLYEWKEVTDQGAINLPWETLTAAGVASLILGWLALHGLNRYMRNGTMGIFSWYRLGVAGAAVFYAILFRV